MAKSQDLKRRIRSVRNTMQVTRAMKMVSAAKLRRSQDRILSARPYAQRTLQVLRSLAARVVDSSHPYLQERDGKMTLILTVTGDKGLCGAFNSNILRTTEEFARIDLRGHDVSACAVGKKGRDYFKRRNWTVRENWVDIFRNVQFQDAEAIAESVAKLFVDKEVDRVYLAYNEFKSAIQARAVVQQLLPVERIPQAAGEVAEEYIFEPSAQVLLDALLPHYLQHQVYQALLESVAAEHAARMTAMDSATNNASELIDSLTLTMNRVRQASITTEIIEVVSGAEALG